MKPHPVSPLQLAWLAEIGVDTHWLSARAAPLSAPAAPVWCEPPANKVAEPAGVPAAPAPPVVRRSPAADAHVPVSPDAMPQAQEGPDALALAVQACLQGMTGGQRGRAVPGFGVRERPRYFIVGEQPGIEDDAVGRPFQGDPGRLLQAMLSAARLPQAGEAYYTTLVKCRAIGGRAPLPDEIAACLPYLQQEIAQVRPGWILALGAVAAQAVLQSSEDLDVLRGGRHVWTGPDGTAIPVWVTHHPSSLLVRSACKLEAWRDLVALAQAVESSGA